MADINSNYDLDISKVLKALDQVDARFETHIDRLRSMSEIDIFKDASKGADDFDKDLLRNISDTQKLEKNITELRDQITRLTTEHQKAKKAAQDYVAVAKYKKVQEELKRVTDELKRVNKELDNTNRKAKSANGFLANLKGSLVGALGGLAGGGGAGITTLSAVIGGLNPILGAMTGLLGGVASKALTAQANWQSLSATLDVALGSSELTVKNLTILEKLAIRLPSGLNELSAAFTALVNRGFKPAKDEIASLSGLAAGQNKTFDQLIQAILDAEEGELERLKEFGIQARNESGKVSVTFKGVTKTFEKGARDSVVAFAELAKAVGSDKLNAAKMQTLAGRMSNIGDQADRVTRLVGKALIPIFNGLFTVAEKVLGVLDRTVTAWTDYDDALVKAGVDSDKVAYPALERLFGLFSDDGGGGFAEKWIFNFRLGWEALKTVISQAVSELEYFNNVSAAALKLLNPTNGYNLAQFKKDRDEARKIVEADRKQTDANFRALHKVRYAEKSTKEGELEYGAGFKNTPVGPTKEEQAKLKAAQEKYQDELLKLEREYGKERLESMKQDELKYIDEKAKFAKEQIEIEKKMFLATKQAAQGKKATLSEKESGIFTGRADLVDKEADTERAAYQKEQAEKANDVERQINANLADEFQKRVQVSEYGYDELIAQAEKYGADANRIAKLKGEKTLATEKIYLEKEMAALEKRQQLEINSAGIGVLSAQLTGRKALVQQATLQELDIQKRAAQERLDLLNSKSSSPNLVEQAQIQDLIKQIKEYEVAIYGVIEEQKKADKNSSFSEKFLQSLGMTDDQVDDAMNAVDLFADSVQNSISELYNTLNQLSQQRIADLDKEIAKKEEQYETEKDLNSQGVANNLDIRQKELDELKALRQKALDDQRKLQKQQFIADTAVQASSMITAASKVFSGFSGIPVVGVGLGIAAVGLMLGAFAAAKIKAFQLVKQTGAEQYGDGGEVGGRLHRDGGTLIEAEKGEYVINRKSTDKYADLVEAINDDNKSRMMDYMLRELLSGTGVTQSDPERAKTMEFIREHHGREAMAQNETLQELKALRLEVSRVTKNTANIPKEQHVGLGATRYMRISKNNTTVVDLPEPKK